MRASIIIPTFNGGVFLIECVKSILSQNVTVDYEIIIIDSESTDGSIQECSDLIEKKAIKYKIISIKQKDFNHGNSRNLAIKHCCGEIVVLLTQDAVPCNSLWLSNLIMNFEADSEIVGVFGRHKAHKNHPKIIQRDIENHFLTMAQTPIRTIDDIFEYHRNESLRQKLHFFSNNNSAIRRSTWEKIPFPEVAYGEDQTWAKAILEKGFKIKYCDDASVYHSHDYSLLETFSRTKTEVTFFKNYFNYNLSKSPISSLKSFLWAIANDYLWLKRNKYFSLFEFSKSCNRNLGSSLARLHCYFEERCS